MKTGIPGSNFFEIFWLDYLTLGDETPQFFDILTGKMSLVGWRPCTLGEWEKYDLQHRIRASMKPGLTGMWQVSGRSEITDFDEVVKLDREYIEGFKKCTASL